VCGIAGFFVTDRGDATLRAGERALTSQLDAMGETIRHRGPDAFGSTVRDGVGLHSRRLAILDLSVDGNQPMYSEDGQVAIVFNGEVFNFQSIRAELEAKGRRFRSRSDTEVVLQGYVEWGLEPLLRRTNGFFAFAIHDRRARKLLVARDRLGVKPLYYAETSRGLVFGSELKALLAEGALARDVDPAALLDYLCLRYVPAPRTVYRGARKLPAGHYLEASLDDRGVLRVATKKWWDFEPAPLPADARPEKVAEQVWELLVDAVRLRLISDVPLGAFLSGGLDSSAVVAAMAQLAKSSGSTVNAVTVGFRGSDLSEVEHARVVADALHVRHVVDEVEPAAIDHVDAIAQFFDEPFSDPSSIPTWLLAQRARREVTVALSGDGGDECFAGYRRYRFDLAEHRVRSLLPGPLFRGLFAAAGAAWPKGDWVPARLRAATTLANLGRDPAGAYFRSVCQMDVADARALLRPELRELVADHDPSESIRQWYDAAPVAPHDSLARAQYCDLHTWLPEYVLTKSDRATMAASLEAREPLLDHRLVTLGASLPRELKVRGAIGKWILRRAVEPHLPKHTIERGKQGFTPPLRDWVDRELSKPATKLDAPAAVDPRAFERLVGAYRGGRRSLAEPLYSLRVLRAFERRWLAA
jgi:asparagine synthase (glutamine-hydrolysing)